MHIEIIDCLASFDSHNFIFRTIHSDINIIIYSLIIKPMLCTKLPLNKEIIKKQKSMKEKIV